MSAAVAKTVARAVASRVSAPVALDKALEGGRVLFRHFLSQRAPVEGWVREFSADGRLVRISKTPKAKDAGQWHRVYDLRVEAVLSETAGPTFGDDDGEEESRA
jgi:hypothetical protein